MASIVFLPHVFGWMVFQKGYGIGTRTVVSLYMLLSAIPLWFLIATLWTSHEQIRTMAHDFDRNREVAARNAGEAKGYMQQYNSADLGSGASSTPAPTGPDQPVTVESVRLAQDAEKGTAGLARYAGRPVTVSGRATAAATGGQVYLQGGETYPAVTLHYAGAAPSVSAGETVRATCASMTIATAGPDLASCR